MKNLKNVKKFEEKKRFLENVGYWLKNNYTKLGKCRPLTENIHPCEDLEILLNSWATF